MNFRDYTTKQSAQRALRKDGLQNVPVTFEAVPGNVVGRTRVRPVLQFDLDEDVQEANRRGFKAVKTNG